MMDKNKQPGISFDSIMLIKENFYRAPSLPEEIKMNLHFESNINIPSDSNKASTLLETVLIGIDEDNNEVLKLECSFVGVFSIIDNDKNMDLKDFADKNSAAIIFPYVREHISSVTQKAGISPIILAPINIQALLNSKEKDVESV